MTESTTKKLPIEQRIYLHSVLVDTQVLPSCINCINQQPTTLKPQDIQYMQCLKFNARPPLHIVVRGCPDWEGDIPF